MADITVNVPKNTFTITKPNTSFTVTTPTANTINVGTDASTINVTSDNISYNILPVGITNTDQLIEGSVNLFYTDSRARSSISVNDTGGYGSLTYNTGTGVISFSGVSTSEIRGEFSAGTGVAINSGQISIGQSVATTDTPTFDQITISSSPVNNSDVATKEYVDTATSGVTPLSTDDLPEGVVNLYYTEQRVDDHVFTTVKIDNKLVIDTSTEINTNEISNTVIDSWPKATYRTVKYTIQASQSSKWQTLEALVIHDGSEAYITQYADVKTSDNLITSITATVVGSQVYVSVLPASGTATTFRVTKILMTI